MKRSFLIIIAWLLAFNVNAQMETEGTISPEAADTTSVSGKQTPVTDNTPRPTTSPVDIDDEKPRMVLHYYDQHGEPLNEPVLFLAALDTVQKAKSKPFYPIYNGMNFGVNFGDLVFMAFGQKHASFDIWANVSLHNWFFPTLECGLGYANDTPANENFTYKTRPSFYAKVGLNYNFLYKSNPDYQVFLGVRGGFSQFSYDLTNVTINSDYWGESQNLQLKGLKSTSLYGEVLAGLQVKIVGGFSLGWNLRWHMLFHASQDGANKPWFIPGYGGSSPFTMNISAIWTIGRKAARTDD